MKLSTEHEQGHVNRALPDRTKHALQAVQGCLSSNLTCIWGSPEMVGLSLAARWASLRLPRGATPHPIISLHSPHPADSHRDLATKASNSQAMLFCLFRTAFGTPSARQFLAAAFWCANCSNLYCVTKEYARHKPTMPLLNMHHQRCDKGPAV